MRCTFLPGGVIVCGSRGRLPSCSTPGCRGKGELSCDHAVKRDKPPKAGDARLHRTHGVVFYVWAIDGDEVTLSTAPLPVPGQRRSPGSQVVTLAELAERSDPTCDRPVCKRCAGHDGELDFCGAHARDRASQRQLPAKGAQ
jgi:hypothetical protein